MFRSAELNPQGGIAGYGACILHIQWWEMDRNHERQSHDPGYDAVRKEWTTSKHSAAE